MWWWRRGLRSVLSAPQMGASRVLAGIALLVALVVVVPAAAFQIESESPVTYIQYNPDEGGPVVKQNRTFSVRCDATDYGSVITNSLVFADGKPGRFNVTCATPSYRFSLQRVGWIPAEGQLTIIELCSTLAGPVASAPEQQSAGVKHRNIHRTNHAHVLGTTQYDAHTMPRKRRVDTQFFAAAGAMFLVNEAICQGTKGEYGYGCSGGTDCPTCVSKADFDASIAAQAAANSAYNQALEGFNDDLVDVVRAQAGLSRQLSEIANKTTNAVQAMLDSQLAAFNLSGQLAEFETKQAAQLDTKFGEVEGSINRLEGELVGLQAQVANFSIQVDDALRTAMNYTASSFLEVTSTFNTYKNLTRAELDDSTRLLNRLVRASQTMAALIAEVERQDSNRVALTRSVHAAAAEMRNRGLVPFLANLGAAPTDNSAGFAYVNIDSTRFNFVTAGGKAVITRLRYNCGTRYLLARNDLFPDDMGILQKLGGPVACDTNNPDTCYCWVEVSAQSCTRNLLASWTNVTDSDTLTSFHCEGAITTSTTQVIKSFTALASYWQENTNSPCQAVLPSTSIKVASSALGKVGRAYHDNPICTVASTGFLDRTLRPPVGAPMNPFLAMLYLWGSARKLSNQMLDELDAKINGQLPSGGITFETIPFTRRQLANDGSPLSNARCVRASFMSYSDAALPGGALPVYRVVPSEPVVQANSSVEELGPSGAPTRVYATGVTGVTLNVPIGGILPNGEYIAVGNPGAGDGDVIYNIPQRSQSLGEAPASRALTPFYNVARNASDLNSYDAWVATNGNSWNALFGQATADFYEAEVGALGVCSGPRDPGDGSLCVVRDSYTLTSSGTQLVAVPRGGFYQARVLAPDGGTTIIGAFVSVCPIISSGVRTGAGIEMQLMAQSNLRTQTQLVLTYEGACYPDGKFQGVSLSPGQTLAVWVPVCAEGNGQTRVFVSTVHPFLGTLAVCSTRPFDATVNATYYTEVQGLVDSGRVLQIAEVNVNQVALEANRQAMILAGLIADVALGTMQALNDLQLALPTPTFVRLNATLGAIVGFINDSSAILANRTIIDTDFEARRLAFENATAAQRNTMVSHVMDSQALLLQAQMGQAALTADLNSTLALIDRLENSTLTLEQAAVGMQNASMNTTILFMRNMVAIQGALATGDSSGLLGDSLDFFGAAVDFLPVMGENIKVGFNGAVKGVGQAFKEVSAELKELKSGLNPFSGVGESMRSLFMILIVVGVIGTALYCFGPTIFKKCLKKAAGGASADPEAQRLVPNSGGLGSVVAH